MRIIVFGASGSCGRHFVTLAADRGHQLTAIARATAPVDVPRSVELRTGNVLDAAFVRDAVPGHDAVMSALGMRYRHPWAPRLSPDDFISRATGNIVAAMQAAGVLRISVISAGGIGDSRRHLNAVMRVLVATSNVGVAYADLERTEALLRSSGLDWQAVRPTTLTRRDATQRARITDRYPMTATIPREEVARFILDELERPQFTARTPMITAA